MKTRCQLESRRYMDRQREPSRLRQGYGAGGSGHDSKSRSLTSVRQRAATGFGMTTLGRRQKRRATSKAAEKGPSASLGTARGAAHGQECLAATERSLVAALARDDHVREVATAAEPIGRLAFPGWAPRLRSRLRRGFGAAGGRGDNVGGECANICTPVIRLFCTTGIVIDSAHACGGFLGSHAGDYGQVRVSCEMISNLDGKGESLWT